MENSSGPFLECTNRSFDLWYVHTGSGLGEYDLGTPKNKNEILARLAQYTILRTHPQVVEEDEDEKDDEDDEDDDEEEKEDTSEADDEKKRKRRAASRNKGKKRT